MSARFLCFFSGQGPNLVQLALDKEPGGPIQTLEDSDNK